MIETQRTLLETSCQAEINLRERKERDGTRTIQNKANHAASRRFNSKTKCLLLLADLSKPLTSALDHLAELEATKA